MNDFCYVCKKELTDGNACWKNGERLGRCKECAAAYMREYRKKNPDYKKADSLDMTTRKLNLPKDFKEYFLSHPGVCEICGEPPENRSKHLRLCVDHDHETEK